MLVSLLYHQQRIFYLIDLLWHENVTLAREKEKFVMKLQADGFLPLISSFQIVIDCVEIRLIAKIVESHWI